MFSLDLKGAEDLPGAAVGSGGGGGGGRGVHVMPGSIGNVRFIVHLSVKQRSGIKDTT